MVQLFGRQLQPQRGGIIWILRPLVFKKRLKNKGGPLVAPVFWPSGSDSAPGHPIDLLHY